MNKNSIKKNNIHALVFANRMSGCCFISEFDYDTGILQDFH